MFIGRRSFSREEQPIFYRQKQGYESEKKLYHIFKNQLKSNHIPLHGLLLNNKGSVFQLDSLLIFSNQIILLEVKYHQGEFEFRKDRLYSFTRNRFYRNPLHQLQRSEINLRELLNQTGLRMRLSSYVIFVHQDFTLFTEKNASILLPSQITSFIHRLNKIPGTIERSHKALAANLIASHLEDSPHTVIPEYQLDKIRKGVLCHSCRNPMQLQDRNLNCLRCTYKESVHSGVLRAVIEFNTLFPDVKITTKNIFEWCQLNMSSRTIRRILQEYLQHHSMDKKSYFTFKTR